jgi:hypothetical protein
MGRKSVTFSGVSTSGIRAMVVSFHPSGSFPPFSIAITSSVNFRPTMSQKFLKKTDGMPSGPGAFKSPIESNAFFISSSVNSVVRC